MCECGSLGLLVSGGGAVRAVSSHSRRFIMKKKPNHFTAKRKNVKTAEEKVPVESKKEPVARPSLYEEDQGFGGWLKSPDGIDTMKLFVIANSIVMLTTIVYPHIQNVYGILSEMFYGDDDVSNEF